MNDDELIPIFNPQKDGAALLSPEELAIAIERRQVSKHKKSPLTNFQADKGLDRVTDAQFNELVIKRMELFRCDALDALHDLAMMPITKNSALNNIKYLAACRLAGAPVPTDGGAKGADFLQSLNERFHSTAQRIKELAATERAGDKPLLLLLRRGEGESHFAALKAK